MLCRVPSTACVLVYLFCAPLNAQTTQGLILGRIVDSVTGAPVASASLKCSREGTNSISLARVSSNGDYAVPSLSPGRYIVTVSAPNYQMQEARAVDVAVAGRIELNFQMRPLYDIWEAGQFRSVLLPRSQQSLAFYGPDVDTSRVAVFDANRGAASPLETSRSDVIGRVDIENLPLEGRDVYTMLLLLPGVTSDTATARGLGFSVNGQRPSSSNYLLDGVNNNNLLVTGPLTAAIPEFIDEYRISTTNYSAEYGRTSGFIANAVTRTGTNNWHGRAFFYMESDRLNANGFQENAQGIPRQPFTQVQPGLLVGGPIIRNRLFLFGAFETARSHGLGDPQLFGLPTAAFINSLPITSYAGQLLRTYAPEAVSSAPGDAAPVTIAPRTEFNRLDGLLRADFRISSRNEVFARATFDQVTEPYLFYSPYRDLSTPYGQHAVSVAAGVISRLSPRSQNEFRAARTGDLIQFEAPHGEIPTLIDDESLQSTGLRVLLPGSPTQNSYRHGGAMTEFLDNRSWINGRHVTKIGGGFLERSVNLRTTAYPGGFEEFQNLADFAQNKLYYLLAEFDASSATHEPVAPHHSYRYRQAYGFVQDSFHFSDRLTFDYGIRYDYFGSPVNTGPQKDLLLKLGNGPDIESSISQLTQVLPAGKSNEIVFSAKPSNWAIRSGMAWDPFGTGRTLFRMSYGIFYDTLFDNLWEDIIQNRYRTGRWFFNSPVTLPAPLSQLESQGTFQNPTPLIAALAFQPNLKYPRTQSAFLGVQQRLTPNIVLDVSTLASRGRGLITTDVVNRPNSVTGYINANIPNYIDYRANQGSSDYTALVTTVRFRLKRFNGQVSYTWSHSIDNQSEPLAGTFFDFNTFTSAQKQDYAFISAFERQFDSNLDRGNSDFDQRHNLVFFGTYQPPALRSANRFAVLLRNWTIAGLGAVRSGLPYTVFTSSGVNERADMIAPGAARTASPVPGGELLLNAAAFADPGPDTVGNSGRNAFTGPGLFNLDASISRSFQLTRSRESMRLITRADFYNVVNHANLNNPVSYLGNPDFGIALYGRRENNSGFPLLAPLNETARQIQILLRIEF